MSRRDRRLLRTLGALAALLLVAAAPAPAELRGRVVLDADGDGVAGADEPPLAGVVVSNGRDIARSAADGRFALPEREAGLLALTRPDGYACDTWWRKGSGDFALRRVEAPSDFTFVQISDAHVYPDPADFEALPSAVPDWLPRRVAAWLTLRVMDDAYAPRSRAEIVGALRAALAPHRDVADAGDTGVFMAYFDEFFRAGSELGRVEAAARAAFAEVAALAPAFVVSTGDLVLEGNQGAPAAVRRWFELYRELSRSTGLVFYDTIGNNEIAGNANPDFPPEHPDYGRALYREFHGPTHYSFDRGPFHFVALDTHRPAPRDDEPEWWDFGRMGPEVRAWLDADLAAHADRVAVVLNHEPFHHDPSWGDPGDARPADDEGRFAAHGVAYVLAGHIHRNGFEDAGPTTHITTGALSGFRWTLPAALHPRGYRLVVAHDGRLYSAWKELGRPALGFVEPVADPRGPLFPASKAAARADALRAPADVVAVAVDAAGPFATVSLRLDDQPVPVSRWGDYFVHARLDATALGPGPHRLELRARDGAGRTHRAELPLHVLP